MSTAPPCGRFFFIASAKRRIGAAIDAVAVRPALSFTADWCRAGLASRLMQELIRSAHARGLKGMEGIILSANTPMRKLARRLGFQESTSSDEPGVVRVRLDLDCAQAGGPPGGHGAA